MRETETSAPSLGELSEAVPQCEWKASGRYIGTANHMSLIGECRDENGNWSDTKTSKAKAAFVARLASDYFAGRLIDPTAMAEAVASARAEGWQPIETAPKEDEVEVDLWLVDRNSGLEWRQVNAWRDQGCWIIVELEEVHELETANVRATHWRLPPAPPTLIPGGSSDV